MTQNWIEICTILVNDLYGELSSQVFSILMRLGRASFSALIHETRLPSRNLRNALAVLIQQQLCLWYTDEDGLTHYEAESSNAYALVQSGKIIKITEERCGEAAGILMFNLLELGHCKVGDLLCAYKGLVKEEPSTSGIDHHHVSGPALTDNIVNFDHSLTRASGQIKSIAQVHLELHKLLSRGFVAPITPFHFKPHGDIQNEARIAVQKEEFPDGITGIKKAARYEAAVIRRMKKWRNRNNTVRPSQSTSKNLKRKRDERDFESKHEKTNGNVTNGLNGFGGRPRESDGDEDDYGTLLDENLVVGINHEKFNVFFRNEQLAKLSERFLGETSSKVYGTTLRLIEKNIERCYDPFGEALENLSPEEEGDSCDDEDHVEPSVTTYEVATALDPSIDLKAGLGLISDRHDQGEDQGRQQVTISGDHSDGDDVRSPRVNGARPRKGPEIERQQLVRQHMEILGEDPRHFVRWHGSRGGGEWGIDFKALTMHLIQIEIENTVAARFGRHATRVIRVLHSKGKLDVKQVSKFAFLREKYVRVILTKMQEVGFVEVQEVPKDNIRQPNRTIFLWYFDQDRCRRLILNDTYQAMARLLQKAKFERRKVKDVVDKAERTDVQGKEDIFLSEGERMALKRWLEVEEILLTQLSRQDDLVALFRDFIRVEAV